MVKKILIAVLLIMTVAASLVVFGLFTARGSRFIVDGAISHYVHGADIQAHEFSGTLMEGVTLRDIELNEIKDLPEGSVLRVQRLFVNLTSLSLDGLTVEVDNARLTLPNSEPVVVSGVFKGQEWNFNIFSRGFSVNEVLSYLPDFKGLIPLKGDIREVDLYIKGSYKEPRIVGDFMINQFIYEGFVLSSVSCKADITLKDINEDIKLFGFVETENGTLDTRKTLVTLEPGAIYFSGPWDQPRLMFSGKSRIDNTTIHMSVKGPIEKPDLKLTSNPPYSEQKLMVMLATGKRWRSVESALDSGEVSPGLTADFIDYFFFAGQKNKFAEKFGISEFTVLLDRNTVGVGAKKDLSNKLQVGYDVQQTTTEEKGSLVTQKAQGEYKVTDQVSVGVERKFKQEERTESFVNEINEPRTEDKVYLKYQKEF